MTVRPRLADTAYSQAPGVNRSAFAPVLSVDGTAPAYHRAGTDDDARVVHGPGEARPWLLALLANPWLTFHPDRVDGVIGRAGARRGEDGGTNGAPGRAAVQQPPRNGFRLSTPRLRAPPLPARRTSAPSRRTPWSWGSRL